MWSLVASGTVTCVLGLMQYLNPDTKTAIGLQGLGEDVATRVAGTYGNPNFFAEFLLLLFVVTLALALAEKGALRWLALVLCGGQALILVLTYTRGSMLALAAGIVVMALLIDARWLWAFLALGVGALAAAPGALSRIVSSFSLEGTASFRLRLWRVTGEIIASHPIVGVGIGGFVPAFKVASLARPDIAVNFLIYGAHNSYYTIAAETGVIGAIAFVLVIVTCARMGLYYAPRMRSDRRAFLANAALTAGLVGFGLNALTSNSFQHPQAAIFFWVIAGLQAGLGASFWSNAAEARVRGTSRFHAPKWLTDSYIGGGIAAFVRWLPTAWTASDVDHWLTGRPAGADSILQGSWLLKLVLGGGSASDAAATGTAAK
jgi:O-antigen ligase